MYHPASAAAEELLTSCFTLESGVQVVQWNSPDKAPQGRMPDLSQRPGLTAG